MRSIVLLFALAPMAALAAPPTGIHYTNVTGSRVVTNTTDSSTNEKEVELGDIDNDGDLDVVMAVGQGSFGSRTNKMYRNDGGTLVEVSGTAIISDFSASDLSRRAFLRDYDGDGWNDLVVVNDIIVGGYAGATHYWENRHPGGVFSHFQRVDSHLNGLSGYACGAASADFDDDGDDDLYLGNYPGSSQDTMYWNAGGSFSQAAASFVPSDGDYSVDVATADLNGDGSLDMMVSNHWDDTWIYYNNLSGTGAKGDYAQPGSTQLIRPGVAHANAMEAGDFDDDGDLDVYHANYSGDVDAILLNLGNDANGKVIWNPVSLAGTQSQRETKKVTVADLDGDGRPEIIASSMAGRPTVLRNASVNGALTLLDWTPPAFGSNQNAFGTAAGQLTGSPQVDILVGGSNGDDLFAGTPTPVTFEGAAGGALPAFTNAPSLLIGTATAGTSDSYGSGATPGGPDVAIVARSCGDIVVHATGSGLNVSSDRQAVGNEEVLAFAAPAGGFTLTVEVVTSCGDGDGDGDVDAADVAIAVSCGAGPHPASAPCSVFDVDRDGMITRLDRNLIGGWARGPGVATTSAYLVEVLGQ